MTANATVFRARRGHRFNKGTAELFRFVRPCDQGGNDGELI